MLQVSLPNITFLLDPNDFVSAKSRARTRHDPCHAQSLRKDDYDGKHNSEEPFLQCLLAL